MNTDKALLQKDLSERVLGAFWNVYNSLGHGFLESVYENALVLALAEAGLSVERQFTIAVHFRGHCVGEFRADLVIERSLIVEVKAQSTLVPANEAQLLNYLKATHMTVGLLLDFGPRPQFKRRVFTESFIRVHPCQSAAEQDVH